MNMDLRDRLIEVAVKESLVIYSEIAEVAGLHADDPGFRFQIGEILDQINWHEHRNERPLLSAVAVAKEDKRPGFGFFENARDIGVYARGDKAEFWSRELIRVYSYWRDHSPRQSTPRPRTNRYRRQDTVSGS